MATLEMEVRAVVESFLKSGELFTALDVSNKVKMVLPFARHREVRDVVRSMFSSDIEPAGWNRTDISVTLEDGSQVMALLYHPLVDSWDLDNKYDLQRRSQASVKTGTTPVAATASGNGTVTVTPAVAPVVTPVAPVAAQVVAQAQAKDLWAQMFNSKPSLFPLK